MDAATELRFSGATSKLLDWRKIEDTARAMLDEMGVQRSGNSGGRMMPADPTLISEGFASIGLEFRRVLAPLHTQVKIVVAIIVFSLALTIAGASLAMIRPWSGGFLSLSGVGAMLGFINRAWQLGKDQAMLELIPARFKLALQFSSSPEQSAAILKAFLKETTSLRR